MSNPVVSLIIGDYLTKNGYDGLFYLDVCSCGLDELMHCVNDNNDDCQAGHKIPCDPKTCSAEGDCEFRIGIKE